MPAQKEIRMGQMPFHRFLEIVRGGFVGLAIGDALGVHVETCSHEEIMKATGGEGVAGYILPKQTRVKDTEDLPHGSTSDDTQLALVTSRSLARRRGFDLHDQAAALVEAYETSEFGWGGTTARAAMAFKKWRDTRGKEGRHPEHPTPPPEKEGGSAGNGPAMKIFPLAAYDLFGRYDTDEVFLAHAMDLGRMTHGDLRASIASVALGHAIAAFADAPADRFREETSARVMERAVRAEKAYRYCRPQTPAFSLYLARAFALMDDPVALREEVNAGFLAVHGVPFAIATALRHPDDFRTAVLEGVNAGHDTYTIGSMIGAMLGCRVGAGGIPGEWRDGLRGADGIIAGADALAMACYGLDPDDAKRAFPPWLKDGLH